MSQVLAIGGQSGGEWRHPVEIWWLTSLSDEYEAVLAEPGELDIKGIYSVEQTLGPREGVW